MHNQLLAFDFDGTLFDTNEANQKAYDEALRHFGYNITLEYYIEHCVGKDYKSFLPQLIGNSSPELLAAIHEFKRKCYKNYYGCIKPNDELFTIIKKSRTTHKIALVTTASKTSVLEILSCFSAKQHFDIIVAKENVTRLKPDPEGYFLAMTLANATPETTTIYEDSATGIKAAQATNARVIKVGL